MANWSDDIKLKVWNKCRTIPGKSEKEYRLDEQGAQIKWSDYGKYTGNGWQIDHIYPEAELQELGVEQEKIDDETNLRALNSFNNDTKSNSYPNFDSSKEYDKDKDRNVDVTKHWNVTPSKQAQLKKYFGIK